MIGGLSRLQERRGIFYHYRSLAYGPMCGELTGIKKGHASRACRGQKHILIQTIKGKQGEVQKNVQYGIVSHERPNFNGTEEGYGTPAANSDFQAI